MWAAGVFKPVLWWGRQAGRLGGGSWLIDQSWAGWSGAVECGVLSDLTTGSYSLLQSRLFLAKRPWELWRVNTEPGLRPVNILLPPTPPPPRAQSAHYTGTYSSHQFHFQSWWLLAGGQYTLNILYVREGGGREGDEISVLMSILIILLIIWLWAVSISVWWSGPASHV